MSDWISCRTKPSPIAECVKKKTIVLGHSQTELQTHTSQGFATKIVNRYFQEHIPRAIEMAKHFRESKKRNFVYQMHAWILNLYVNCVSWTVDDGCPENSVSVHCPSENEIKAFDEAVRSGDIVWTHSPFNINPELVGCSFLFEDSIQVANSLDERYGMKNVTRVWSNVDVKGFARSAIPLLKRAGFEALYVGQNGMFVMISRSFSCSSLKRKNFYTNTNRWPDRTCRCHTR